MCIRDREARFAPTGLRARVSVAAGWRFGTGAEALSRSVSYFLPTGTGANALLLRGAADVGFGRHAWASVAVRYTKPMEQTFATRIPDVPSETILALYREASVLRTLGQTLELEVTPRWAVNGSLAVAAQYLYRNHSADAYTGSIDVTEEQSGFGDATLDASVLGLETAAHEQRLGLGFSYSSVDAWRRRRTRFPVDVTYLRTRTLTADGGYTPQVTTDELRVRVLTKWFGGR